MTSVSTEGCHEFWNWLMGTQRPRIPQRANEPHPSKAKDAIKLRFGRLLLFSLLGTICVLLMSPSASAQQTQNPASRPIVFVHGWCGDADSWLSLRGALIHDLTTTQATAALYPDATNIDVFYDGVSVKRVSDGLRLDPSNTGVNARFFSIQFYSPLDAEPSGGGHFNKLNVLEVSVFNKADELAKVIQAITNITHIQDVIVIAHSMGGLVARTYLQNLGADFNSLCFDTNFYSSCVRGSSRYLSNVGSLITIDTPHGGTFTSLLFNTGVPACFLFDGLNRRELSPTSYVVQRLAQTSNFIPNGVDVVAVKSYYTTQAGFYSADTDGIVSKDSQSYVLHSSSPGSARDLDNPFSAQPLSAGCFFISLLAAPLHVLDCVGAQNQTQGLVKQEILRNVNGKLTEITISANGSGISFDYLISRTDGSNVPGVTGQHTYFGAPQPFPDVPPGQYEVRLASGTNQAIILPSPTQTLDASSWQLSFVFQFPRISIFPTSGTPGSTIFVVTGTGFTPNSTVTQNITLPDTSTISLPQSAATGSNGSYTFSIPANLLTMTGTYSITATDDPSGVQSNYGNQVQWTVTASALLPPPTTKYPGSPTPPGNTISMTTPTFLWMPVSGATGYKLYISKYPYGFANLITPPNGIDIPGGASFSYTLQQGLLSNGGLYRWDMTTVSPAGEGSPASDLYFQVASAPVVNDFSLTVLPTGQSVTQGNSAAYSIGTTITAGASQNIVLQVSGLPSGASAAFSPSSIPSGSSASLTVSTTASTPSGTYPLLIQATGSSVTHTQQINLSVSGATPGVPNLSITPPFWNFGNQTVGTGSQAQAFTLSNTGNAALSISSLVANPQNEFFPAFLNAGLPLTIATGASVTLQVTFVPQAAGFRTGQIQLYTNAPNGIYTIVLNGTGVAAQPTTGNIQVNATFNGQPWSGFVVYQLDGPQQYRPGTAPNTVFNVVPGDYTITYLGGGPGGASLVPISPATQTLAAGSTVTYTLNFTGTNDFSISWFSANTLGIRAGGTAQYTVQASYIKGATQNITLDVAGLPGGASFSASPNPVSTQNKAALSILTSATTPPGIHSFTVSGTNADGLTKQLQGTLVVTNPPSSPIERVSVSSNETEGNGASVYRNGISQDGRYVVFDSQADNLVPGSSNTNGLQNIFVRDGQNGQTIWVSQAFDGSQANSSSYSPAISADGRFVVFPSNAGNLVGPGQATWDSHVFLRDLLMNVTTQVDVGSDGTPADKGSCCASISADGRFVVFASSATNLGAGSTNTNRHVYLLDRLLQKTLLVSVATDGSPGDQGGFLPVISADGRFVAFVSNSTNLVPNDTNGFEDLFVRDLQTLVTVRANVATDGTQSNRSVWRQDQPTISADGRFVAFMSNASNLAPEAADQSVTNVFLRDLLKGETFVVSLSNDGTNTGTGGTFPVVSADGHFVVFFGANQQWHGWQVRDRIANKTAVLDVASDGSLSNATTQPVSLPAMTSDGRSIVFLSIASNLVSNDTNNVADTFVATNPWVGSPSISSFALDMTSATGGATPTATLSLSTAPANDAVIELQSNNAAVQIPPTVTVAAGSSSVQFSVATLGVASEVTAVIVASYNGSSPIALLTLTPPTPSSIVVTGGDGQAATLGAAFGTALQVSVLDNLNNPVVGAQVTFMAPSSGASGTFSNGTDIATTTTDANGFALAPAFTASNISGGYAVTAAVVGIATPAVFNLTNLHPTPSITPVPGSAVANAGGFTLSVTGSNFVSGSAVRWNGQDRTTTYVSSTQLNADISASDVSAVGNAQVTVFNPGPGGGLSNPWQFPILPPPVVAVSMNPGTVFAGQSSTGTVTLQFPAPSGGVTVSLTSSDPSVVVPASVAVQAGNLTATFPVTTSLVNAQIVAVITATLNGTAQANFVVDPVLIAVGSLSAPSITILQDGASPAITVNITRTNFTGNVTLALSQLPSGVTATITDPGAGNSGTITLQATSAAAVMSNQTITITASGAGVAPTTVTFDLSINPVSIAISSISTPSATVLQGGSSPTITFNIARTNFTGNVTLTLSQLPSGVTATITDPGSGNTGSIILQASSSAVVVNNQTVTATASGSGVTSATGTFDLTVSPVNIAIGSISAPAVTVLQGGSSPTVTVNVTRTNFTGNVTLAIGPLPSGVTATITDPGTGNSGTITLQAASSATVVSNQTMTITVSSTGIAPATVSFDLTVSPVSISISSVSTPSVTLLQGGTSPAITVNIARTNFSGNVTLTLSPLPSGVTATITNPGAGTAGTIVLQASGSAAVANNQITTVTASGMGITSATATFTLTVNPVAIGIASISASTVTLAQGTSATAITVNVSRTNFTGNVTLTLSSLPSGVTATITDPGAGNSGMVALQAASNAAVVSNQTITVTASGTGLSPVSATFNLTVTTPPSVSLSANSLTFSSQPINTTSAAQSTILTNGGGFVLVITSFAITGNNAGEFVQTNNCGSSVAASASCTITVTFTPTSFGNKAATLTITDSAAGSPHTISLTGTGTSPQLTISTASLAFSSQVVGGTSSPSPITLTNTGNSALTISSITISGTNASDFAKTDNCGSGLAPSASCTMNVTFMPAAPPTPAQRSAILTINDNAPQNPHQVALSGRAVDISVNPAPGQPTAQTINAGQPASFTLNIVGTPGIGGTATFNCTVAPVVAAGPNCTVSPTSATLSDTTPVTLAVNVATTVRPSMVPPSSQPQVPTLPAPRLVMPWLLLALALAILASLAKQARRRLGPALAPFAAVVLLAIALAACGGGGSGPPPPPQQPPGTPALTYTLTVGVTSGGATRTIALTLKVN